MPKSVDEYLDFFLNEKGENVVIRGIEVKAIIIDVKDKITYYDDKMIRTDIEIYTGDIIDYQGDKWIIVSEVDRNKRSYRARMRKVNYNIKIVIEETLYELKSIIEGVSFGIEEGRVMNFGAGKIEVTLSADPTSSRINLDMRFIKMDKVWKVTGVDKSRVGLIILQCEQDLLGLNDDLINEIADSNKLAIYSIIINRDVLQVAKEGSLQLTALVMRNGEVRTDIPITWISDSPDILTIDQAGLITGIAEGSAMVTATIEGKNISDTIEITCIELPSDNFTWEIEGDSIIYYNQTKTYNAIKKNNGTAVTPNASFSFSIDYNGNATSVATLTIVDSDTCTVKANQYNKTIYLKAIDNESGVFSTKTIQLKSLL